MQAVPNDILAVLRRGGFLQLGVVPDMEPLKGGVSSDIWRVELEDGAFCIKRALPKLKVELDWRAPVERSNFEAMWMSVAASIIPDAVPPLLHRDETGNALVMPFLDPESYQSYKVLLMDGRGERWMAGMTAEKLAAIHNATAGDAKIARDFDNDRIFKDIRVEPYLLATAQKWPDLAKDLRQIASSTLACKKALVHGDISPKNILVGKSGMLFLDAECACYGDPAFDLAFCLNHFLLKAAHLPDQVFDHLDFFEIMASTYLASASFEPRDALEARAARLLPGLTLGRIDGRSPVEYIKDDGQKERIRKAAASLIRQPAVSLEDIQTRWMEAFAS